MGADLPTLPISEQRETGADAAVLGYPENGPYAVAPARLGETRPTISEDSYGNGPVERTIVALRGSVRSGNSGGPLVDAGRPRGRHRLRRHHLRRSRAASRSPPRTCARRSARTAAVGLDRRLHAAEPRRPITYVQ